MAESSRLNPTKWHKCHVNMVLFVFRKLILQSCMRSHPVRLDVWFLVGPFVYFHTSCVWTAKALVRLAGCTGLPEPSLVAYVISTIISWAGSNDNQVNGTKARSRMLVSLALWLSPLSKSQFIIGKWRGLLPASFSNISNNTLYWHTFVHTCTAVLKKVVILEVSFFWL